MTYILGAAVAVVWGLIIYRIVAAVKSSDNDDAPAAAYKIASEPYNDFAVAQDTTTLRLNYRDPFSVTTQADTVAITTKKTAPRKPLSLKPAMNWDFIQYAGYIRNPVTKKLITLVNINGHSEMLAEGATAANVTLIRNLRDSIKIRYNGMTKFITRRTQ